MRKLSQWSENGYQTTLHFIEMPSADYAVQRVAQRVAAGGHPIPEEDIRRRFHRGLQLFQSVFKPLPNQWHHWYSNEEGLRLVERRTNPV